MKISLQKSPDYAHHCSTPSCRRGLIYEESIKLGKCWVCREVEDPGRRKPSYEEPQPQIVPPWEDDAKAAYCGFNSAAELRKAVES